MRGRDRQGCLLGRLLAGVTSTNASEAAGWLHRSLHIPGSVWAGWCSYQNIPHWDCGRILELCTPREERCYWGEFLGRQVSTFGVLTDSWVRFFWLCVEKFIVLKVSWWGWADLNQVEGFRGCLESPHKGRYGTGKRFSWLCLFVEPCLWSAIYTTRRFWIMAYSLEGQFSSSTTRDFQGVLDAVKKNMATLGMSIWEFLRILSC